MAYGAPIIGQGGRTHALRTCRRVIWWSIRCAVDVTSSIRSFSAVDVGIILPIQNEYFSGCTDATTHRNHVRVSH
jgi:hypothetical protein|eukprot:COSAG06_NODE_108_length_23594_cov_43.013450_2_plen_75_part_00